MSTAFTKKVLVAAQISKFLPKKAPASDWNITKTKSIVHGKTPIEGCLLGSGIFSVILKEHAQLSLLDRQPANK